MYLIWPHHHHQLFALNYYIKNLPVCSKMFEKQHMQTVLKTKQNHAGLQLCLVILNGFTFKVYTVIKCDI